MAFIFAAGGFIGGAHLLGAASVVTIAPERRAIRQLGDFSRYSNRPLWFN
jgi:hypothetical protein